MKSLSVVFKGLLGEIDRFGGREGPKAYAQVDQTDLTERFFVTSF